MPPRWVPAKAKVLVDQAADLGMTLDQAAAEVIIRDRLQALVTLMRLSEPTARRYLDDDAVRDLARNIVTSFVDEQPGLDLASASPDTSIEPRLAALAVSALSEAILVHLANPDSAGSQLADECVGLLSIHGTRLFESADAAAVHVSRAWLVRAARYIDVAAHTLESGGAVGTATEVEPSRIAEAFRADAALLRAASGVP